MLGVTAPQYTVINVPPPPTKYKNIQIDGLTFLPNGKLVVYRNGGNVLEYTGPTMDPVGYATGHGPHVKMGLYVSHLSRWTSTEKRPTHVIYFDEYRRGYSYDVVDITKHQGD